MLRPWSHRSPHSPLLRDPVACALRTPLLSPGGPQGGLARGRHPREAAGLGDGEGARSLLLPCLLPTPGQERRLPTTNRGGVLSCPRPAGPPFLVAGPASSFPEPAVSLAPRPAALLGSQPRPWRPAPTLRPALRGHFLPQSCSDPAAPLILLRWLLQKRQPPGHFSVFYWPGTQQATS